MHAYDVSINYRSSRKTNMTFYLYLDIKQEVNSIIPDNVQSS